MRLKKFLSGLLATALIGAVAMPLGACGGSSSDANIEILLEGWLNQVLPQDTATNPYNKYLEEKYGMAFTLTNTSDLTTTITKRFSSKKTPPPDVLIFNPEDYASMISLYEQGFLCDDYTTYLQSAPDLQALFADETGHISKKFVQNGNTVAMVLPALPQVWGYKIRQDWVDDYADGKAPSSPEELLTLAEKIKNIAIDSNGDPVYYLFTSAGQQEDFGRDMKELLNIWGYTDWYVTSEGEVSHPILDGNFKTYLDFVKTLVQNKYIQPNWYTDTWENHKSMIYVNSSKVNDTYDTRIGITCYNSSIVTESVFYNDNETNCEQYSHLDMPKASATGNWATVTPEYAGKANTEYSYSKIIVVSADAAEDEQKMATIMEFLNDLVIPSETYYAMRWGIGCDNYEYEDEVLAVKDGTGEDTGYHVYLSQKNKDTHAKHNYGFIDYGAMCDNAGDKMIEYGTALSVTTSPLKYIQLEEDTKAFNQANAKINYAELLQLNNLLYTNVQDYMHEFEINYVQGTAGYTDYQAFVDGWLEIGGSTLKMQAEMQLRAAGYIQ